LLGEDAPTWASAVLAGSEHEPLLRAGEIPLEDLEEVGEVVVQQVGDRRATWKRWNLHAETVRQPMALRFASANDRDVITQQIVDAAERVSLRLTPPELAKSPSLFRREIGRASCRERVSVEGVAVG